MIDSMWFRAVLVIFILLACSFTVDASSTIKVYNLDTSPVLDAIDDWKVVPYTAVNLKSIIPGVKKAKTLYIKAAVHDGEIYLFVKWHDKQAGRDHKPYVWNEQKKRYEAGPQREDRLAIQFEMEGEYTTDWPAAKYFKADMWHWKSYRSAALNLAHDKYTIVSRKKLTRSIKLQGKQGQLVYVRRHSDEGDMLYKTMRYGKYSGEKLPKYIANKKIEGSVADVKARSYWADDKWHVEIRRRLDTGHDDDVKFVANSTVRAGISVFDNSDDDDHLISETLEFEF
ncbi:MAG: ethylbenzene dehydrogenase-related protein [Gammaproteobacteria bacterium]|nr:ethylbenzene dehydrogenase-related protein [Gammaproteobacteria bacterium]